MTGSLDGVNLEYIDSLDKAFDCKRWLGERHRSALGVDIETSGLSPYEPDAKIRLIQFGDEMTGWAMPWDLWKGLALEILNSWDGDFVGHNIGAFDLKWIERHSPYRFPRHRVHDTMLAAHIVDPLGPGGLKPLSRKLIDPRAAGGQNMLDDAMHKNKWTWATVPTEFPPYHMYGALDPVLSCRLHEMFQKKVGPGTEWAGVYELELAVRHIVTRMEQRGVCLDVEYALDKSSQLMAHAEMLKEWGKKHYGTTLTSTQKLVEIFEGLGAEFQNFSPKTNAPSTDKHQLQIFTQSPDPVIKQLAHTILDLRKSMKYGVAFFQNYIDLAMDEPDGQIIHPNIRTLGARTSRMSISAPGLQQVPKQSALVRDAFIPRDGNGFVSTDFAQIEMRLMAHFSGDPDLQKAFIEADQTGGDFFVEVGRAIYNEADFSKADKRRGLVKNVCYGLAYGAGPAKMAESAGVPLEQMKPVSDALISRFPGIKSFMRKIEHEGVQRERATGQGYIVTPYGRRLPCDDGKVYTLVNYMLQGTAAEYFKHSLVALDAAGWGPAMALPIHDEILMDLPLEDVEQAKHDVPLIMQDTENWAVPLLADSDGPWDRWGSRYR